MWLRTSYWEFNFFSYSTLRWKWSLWLNQNPVKFLAISKIKSLLTGSQKQLSHTHSPPPILVLYDFLCLVSLYTSVLSMADLVCVPQNHLPLTMPKYSIRKKKVENTYIPFLLKSKCHLECKHLGLNRMHWSKKWVKGKDSCGGCAKKRHFSIKKKKVSSYTCFISALYSLIPLFLCLSHPTRQWGKPVLFNTVKQEEPFPWWIWGLNR